LEAQQQEEKYRSSDNNKITDTEDLLEFSVLILAPFQRIGPDSWLPFVILKVLRLVRF